MNWRAHIRNLLPPGSEIKVVISPDVDGLLTASTVATMGRVTVVGIYTTRHLILLGDSLAEDARLAVWLDHDVSRPDICCIGQHLTLHNEADRLPLRSAKSFNPNNAVGQAWDKSFRGFAGKSRDKYPFGTVHMVHSALGLPSPKPDSLASTVLAHADGSWATSCDYPFNCNWWRSEFFAVDDWVHALDAYTKSPTTLRQHQALVEALITAGVRRSGSREKTSASISSAWAALQGHQSVPFAVHPNRDVLSSLQLALEKLRAVAAVLTGWTGLQAPHIPDVRTWISGEYKQIFPSQILRGAFDDFMISNHIFSHAFTGQGSLRYTTGLYS